VEFENTFTVKAPVDEVYEALLDLERVTPAMPGAKLLEKTGDDSYKVAIKVKLGPVSMTYRGDVTIVERDAEAHSAVLDVKAKEARGQGGATAKVSMSVAEEGAETRGTMVSTVQLSGKAAAMSRGVIDDVSKRLVDTFASNLEGIVAAPEPADEATTASAPPRPSDEGADEALQVGSLAADMAGERLRDRRVLAALAAAFLLLWLLRRRS
jgi:carbon monoxide dehydrogenase subunit G